MSNIPLLSDSQMSALRRILGKNPSLDMTGSPSQGKSKRLPTYDENNASGEKVVLAKIISGSAATGYSVEFYANGRNATNTGSGTVFLPEVALSSTLPAGTWVLAHLSETSITGGNDA